MPLEFPFVVRSLPFQASLRSLCGEILAYSTRSFCGSSTTNHDAGFGFGKLWNRDILGALSIISSGCVVKSLVPMLVAVPAYVA